MVPTRDRTDGDNVVDRARHHHTAYCPWCGDARCATTANLKTTAIALVLFTTAHVAFLVLLFYAGDHLEGLLRWN